MFRMCASNSHSYTHLILALGIVREPTVWVFIPSKYPGTHDICLPNITPAHTRQRVPLYFTLLRGSRKSVRARAKARTEMVPVIRVWCGWGRFAYSTLELPR